MKRIMTNEQTGQTKTVKIGFSWTTFFFGACVPLLRGDFKWFFIMILLAFITLGISWFVVPFIYNGKYIDTLFEKGYKFA